MVSKTKAEDEKSSEPTSSLILPSLPEDVIIDILARLSRFDYPKLSLVSKHFRSLVASPKMYARRSLLASTEHCLYVAVYDIYSCYFYHWYILCRKANGSRCLVRAPSTLPVLNNNLATSVAVGSRIYVFGGIDHTKMTTNAFCMDCRSHTVEPIPTIPVPLVCTFAGFIDRKIYVIGYCDPYPKKAMLVFDTETQKWEHVMTTPKMEASLTRNYAYVVMADKIYTMDCYGSYVYDPKEGKWETDNMPNSIYWENACVVDDVLYYRDRYVNTLRAYDPIQKSWEVVEGLKELLAAPISSSWSYTVNYGGNLALLFSRPGGIWCAEISLERRQGGQIWGKVEWCNLVLTGNFGTGKCLAVMV
ncbi:F-box/kelch-repeat protein [Raphanus sativus]|uniref:F-box/kelch-repeat protein At4g38940-like n=1 Tax=Raphanus sativus TaxID=3726 RepID=A0A6J0JN94_RAPSA|nr:F-box/kelch-repeat protein At4g38940-like [Raphanus sativus]KAJ4891356.1 F-box/kelch-repeat protein [Raphanus sativus]